MKGVQYIINEKGEKTGVLLDLKKHRELWEDMYDRLLVHQRSHEPRESIQSVKKRLKEQGKLNSDA
jgi:hypothetical protein